MLELRPHQDRAIEQLRASLRQGNRRPMLQLATGAGKTVIAAEIIRMAREKDKRVCFIVDAVSLIDQTVKSFYSVGLHSIGVIQAKHPMEDWSRPIQVASVQTLQRRGTIPQSDIVIVDEAHAQYAWLIEQIQSEKYAGVPFIGLSATPWAKGLGLVYDDLIQPVTMQELIDQGFLSKFRVFAPSKPDLSKVKTVAGEYHQEQLSETMSDEGLIADVVQTWIKLAERVPTLVFAVDRAHAKKLQQRFIAAGFPWGYIDAATEREERLKVREQLDRREIFGVANVGCLTKGVDWAIGCISDAAPTKSEMRHVQKLGRALRVNEGIGDALILDHASNCLRLGFPTDIFKPSLCTKQRGEKPDPVERKEPLPKECPKCTFLKPAKTKLCPACGFEAEHVSKIEEQDGQLVEVKPKATFEEKQRWYSGLLLIQRQRKYKEGWAARQYREKFKVWPEHRIDRNRTMMPTEEIGRWVQARMIRYAKGRRNAA